MVRITASFDLTPAQLAALEFEARTEGKTVDEMVGWMVVQEVPSFLDTIETEADAAAKERLQMALIDEQDRPRSQK